MFQGSAAQLPPPHNQGGEMRARVGPQNLIIDRALFRTLGRLYSCVHQDPG